MITKVRAGDRKPAGAGEAPAGERQWGPVSIPVQKGPKEGALTRPQRQLQLWERGRPMELGSRERDAATAKRGQREELGNQHLTSLLLPLVSRTQQKTGPQEGAGPCRCYPCRSVSWAQSRGDG